MTFPGTAGIIAGGASSRMGTNKALLPVGGRPILERQLDVLRALFARVVVAANDPGPYEPYGIPVVPDLLSQRCALTGLHAVLSRARSEPAFVVACDLPFLNPRLIEALLARAATFDIVLPVSDSGPEPLHALYSPKCLPAIEAAARRGDWKATGFHEGLRVDRWKIRDAEWEVEGRSPFLNVNTPDDLRSAGAP